MIARLTFSLAATLISATLVTGNLLTVTSIQAAEKPNLVFILADDLGWSDTTLYGTTSFYETPNIERLASVPCCLPTLTQHPPVLANAIEHHDGSGPRPHGFHQCRRACS